MRGKAPVFAENSGASLPPAFRAVRRLGCDVSTKHPPISYAVHEMDLVRLVTLAEEARKRAYAPYSKFYVGAAVLSATGRTYTGCNVENATYGATICAERAAVCQMVAAGDTALTAVAVFTDAESPATPCGICRQVLAEFAADALVIVATPRTQKTFSLAALLPERFALLGEGT